jgi:putative membrane protein
MMALFLCLIASLLALSTTVFLVPEFAVNSVGDFALSVFLLTLMNFILTPLLLGLNVRIKVTSLGIFSFILNLLLLNLATGLIDKFSYESLNAAIFGAVLMSFFQIWLDYMDGSRRQITRP